MSSSASHAAAGLRALGCVVQQLCGESGRRCFRTADGGCAGRDRIFNYAEAKEEEEEEEKQGSLFLHGVKGAKMGQPPRAVPLFVTPPFLCEFASASKCSRALPVDALSSYLCLCK